MSVLYLGLFYNGAKCGSLFPDIPGWKMQEEKRVYNAGDLWELIDGAADIFLSYYFQDLHIAEYTNKNQIIRVKLYRHSSPVNAYGIYTAERMPDYPQVKIGTQGYRSTGVMNFLAGDYYVKIMSAGVQEANEQSIAMVAEKIEAGLKQHTELPAVVSLFPDDGKVALSDTYIAQNFLGYSFFHSAFLAHYHKNKDFSLFIIKDEPSEIQHILDQYITMLKEDKVRRNGDLFIVQDLFNGSVFLEKKNNYLVGIFNTDDENIASTYIEKVIEKLP
jgi:hypothetical protein